ncbi:proteasome-type protease [Oxalobacteraceae bacterium]|nr:proteasome-type protease [Oxalobacteraceae bacterium]
MTYCIAMSLDAGLIFLSDSRTNAGVDQVGTFRKMTIFEKPGDRVIVLMTAGNLAISQSVRQLISEHVSGNGQTIWNAATMYEAAQVVGQAVRTVYERDALALGKFGIDFNVSMTLGGQIGSERCRLFQIYSAGNFIESQSETPYFQIGEAKYGKPILDRVITPATPLDEAAKCALISMDSTLRSNISVGLPLDLLVYENNSLAVSRFVNIDQHNQYFEMIRNSWGQQLKRVFDNIADPVWNAVPGDGENVLSKSGGLVQPPRAPAPPSSQPVTHSGQVQTLAQGGNPTQY